MNWWKRAITRIPNNIMGWTRYSIPEDVLDCPEQKRYLVKLANGEIIKASRSNGHWFGMWRWLRDEEIIEWTVL